MEEWQKKATAEKSYDSFAGRWMEIGQSWGKKNENAEQASRETTNNKARAVIEWFRSKHLYIIFL